MSLFLSVLIDVCDLDFFIPDHIAAHRDCLNRVYIRRFSCGRIHIIRAGRNILTCKRCSAAAGRCHVDIVLELRPLAYENDGIVKFRAGFDFDLLAAQCDFTFLDCIACRGDLRYDKGIVLHNDRDLDRGSRAVRFGILSCYIAELVIFLRLNNDFVFVLVGFSDLNSSACTDVDCHTRNLVVLAGRSLRLIFGFLLLIGSAGIKVIISFAAAVFRCGSSCLFYLTAFSLDNNVFFDNDVIFGNCIRTCNHGMCLAVDDRNCHGTCHGYAGCACTGDSLGRELMGIDIIRYGWLRAEQAGNLVHRRIRQSLTHSCNRFFKVCFEFVTDLAGQEFLQLIDIYQTIRHGINSFIGDLL